jgi:TrmH family RNA methyltransferase
MKQITSRDNPGFRELLSLSVDRRARRKAGQTLVDGPHLLQAAVEAGLVIRRLVYAESIVQGPLLAWHRQLAETPAIVLPDRLFASLSPVDTPVGLLAVIDIPAPAATVGNFLVLLEHVQDPGNLGAILRVAAAAAVDAVHLSPGCADAWSPKCLRGGQGAHFQLAIHENVDLPALADAFPGSLHAAMLDAADSLFELDLRGPVGFVFGNEGAGVSRAITAVARPFSIPMPGQVESLNVATAAAICLFERVRQLRAN